MEIESPIYCTILVIGQTGAGKSEFGNAYLKDCDAFEASDSADAVTIETHAKERIIDGAVRCCIDTQGLDDTQGVDAAHIQQMVEFMRSWQKGVNAVAIVINGQAPRLDAGTQRLIKIINNFFNNQEFWNHVCLIFTKSYEVNPVNRNRVEQEYRKKVQDIVVECNNAEQVVVRPQLPVFIVDSKRFDDFITTKNELAAFHGFACGLPPLSTQYVATPDVKFMKIETETETRVLVNEKKDAVYRREKYGSRRYGIAGPRKTRDVFDHYNVRRQYIDRTRKKYVHFDGRCTYDDWETIKSYDEYTQSST
jgi:GTPase SAR1 family protein